MPENNVAVADTDTAIIDFYRTNGISWGAADLFVLGSPGLLARVGEHAAVLRLFPDGDGPLVRRIFVVLPTGGLTDNAMVQVKTGFLQMLERLLGQNFQALAAERAFAGLRIVVQPTMAIPGLADLIRSADPRSAFVVVHAGRYRGFVTPPDRPKPRVPEDTWVPHLHDLATQAVEASIASQSYVALEVGEFAPARLENSNALLSVDGCAVLTATLEGPSVIDLAEGGARLSDLVAAGDLGAALKELREQENVPASARALLRLRLMADAGAIPRVKTELEEGITSVDSLSGEEALQVAILAEEVDADAVATRMLARAIPALVTREELGSALIVADRLDEPALIAAAEDALRCSFPDADLLRRRELHNLLQSRQYAELADRLEGADDPDSVRQAGFWRFLAEHIAAGRGPDVDAVRTLLTDWPDDQAKNACHACALALEDGGQRAEALGLLLEAPLQVGAAKRSLLWAALNMVERELLAANTVVDVRISDAIYAVVGWLAAHPNDGYSRLKLLNLLQPQFLGQGVLSDVTDIILAAVKQDNARRLPRLEERADPCPPEKLAELTRRSLAWLGGEEAIVLGRSVIPHNLLLDVPPEQAVRGYELMLEQASEQLSDDADAAGVETILALASAIAPLSARPDDALVVLRVAAGRLALFGQQQRARDLAEHALKIAGASPQRARLAWFAFADIYARTGNAVEALVGLACSSVIGEPTSWEQVCYERLLAHQIFRNMGIFQLARPMLDSARRAMAEAGLAENYGHRIELADLHLRLLASDRDEATGPELLSALIEDTTRNLERVLAQNEDAGPASVFLASLVRCAMDLGTEAAFPSAVAAIEHARPRLGAGPLARIDAFGPGEVTADRVVAFAKLLEAPRYAEDAAYDVSHLVVGARRLLASPEAVADPIVASLAIEVLADNAVNLPRTAASGGGVLYIDKDGPADAARRLARDGLDVVLLGLGANGLTRVTWSGGRPATTVVEPTTVFSPARLQEWRAIYPHAYGDIEKSDDFYIATQELGVAALPERAVVIAGTSLQDFPLNLLQVQGDLAGNTRRLSTAPSLTWLDAVRQVAPAGDGRVAAWIPGEAPSKGWPILSTVAHTLKDEFDRHGITLRNDVRPPAELAGASLVVVIAHGDLGKLGKRKRYFHSLANDADAAVAGATVAGALSNVGTVVLFVCSGGRLDMHPSANRTVGLVRQLLDRGCRAVIAPPWPIDPAVAVHWLPTFLDHWSSGVAAIDACYKANAAERSASGLDPGRYLAMAVYGDPLTTRFT